MFYYTQCQHLGVNARVCMSVQVCVLYLEEEKKPILKKIHGRLHFFDLVIWHPR